MNKDTNMMPEVITMENFDELKDFIEEMPEGTVVNLDIKVVIKDA